MLVGTTLGPYEIVEPLGHGGMGEVYRARDTRLRRQVAIKTISARAGIDPEARERFDREARAVAALSHSNILAIYDVGVHQGMPFLAVELLDGETLRSRIESSPLPLSMVLAYAAQIGRGLAAAHEHGVIHRDLKPDNVFVTRDAQVKLLDFGLATEPAVETGDASTHFQTGQGTLLGTVGYMSPEQARGAPADARSDIFSFGCVLFELLSGRRAFKRESRVETLNAILKEHPPDVTSLRPDTPVALDRVVRRCLEKAPASRFQSARDLVFALETLAVSSDATPAPATGRLSQRARWTMAAVLGVVVVAGAGILWWALPRSQPPPQPAATPAPAPDPRRRLAVLPFETNAPYPVKLPHAYYLRRSGSTAEAGKIFDAVMTANRNSFLAGADWPQGHLQMGAVHALRGETAAALDAVECAYDAGWRDGRTLGIDPLFASVRSEPRFAQVLSRIESDVAAMRARADYSGLP